MSISLKNQSILVTGSAGFIGFHADQKLLDMGAVVIGIDNFNDYYDPGLKEDRNKILAKNPNFKLYRGDIEDLEFVRKTFQTEEIDKKCHLAAQAGVRYGIDHPHQFINSNIVGFNNVIDEAKNHDVNDFIYASSSSVYGGNDKFPAATTDQVDHPISLYAATKKSNELIAYTYHHLFGVNCTGLRFFTAYGPWGRPDMALFLFTDAIAKKQPIKVFNHGQMVRDFTYIDDIVMGIISSLEKSYPYEIFNLGYGQEVELEYFINCIENELDQKADKKYLPLQPGDVLKSLADIKYSTEKLEYKPTTPIEEGIKKFVDWYKDYYQEKDRNQK
ncbi:NAD-dependent epimerase/dehydratase family protein [Patescibacteria group bacterium]|nr:NAD-dependent epimerase/dehydratase family protein [Patescibacteria group bacterium]